MVRIIVRAIPCARARHSHLRLCSWFSIMPIRDYPRPSNGLSEPTGSLSFHVPSQAIALANKEVEKVLIKRRLQW